MPTCGSALHASFGVSWTKRQSSRNETDVCRASGVVLDRDYHGQTVSVKILDDGFEYAGKIYDSLSSIASVATGTRWNGFAFFGLNKKVQRD